MGRNDFNSILCLFYWTSLWKCDSLKDSFFSINKVDEPIVEAISGIVGENGAGKSSVARALYYQGSSDALESLLVYECEQKVYVSSTVGKNFFYAELPNENSFELKSNIYSRPRSKKFSFIYCSVGAISRLYI